MVRILSDPGRSTKPLCFGFPLMLRKARVRGRVSGVNDARALVLDSSRGLGMTGDKGLGWELGRARRIDSAGPPRSTLRLGSG